MTTVEPVRRFLEAAQSGDRRIIEEYIDGFVESHVFIVKQNGWFFIIEYNYKELLATESRVFVC